MSDPQQASNWMIQGSMLAFMINKAIAPAAWSDREHVEMSKGEKPYMDPNSIVAMGFTVSYKKNEPLV